MVSPDFFVCGNKTISNVIRGNPTYVRTITDHEYHSGLIVRFVMPHDTGIEELNGLTGEITVVNATDFTVPIDSTAFSPFIPYLSPLILNSVPQSIPIAENALTLVCAEINNNNIRPEIEGTIPILP